MSGYAACFLGRFTVQKPDLTSEAQVDARGVPCPMPLLKAKLALNALQAGEVLYVMATDPGSQRDFKSFAQLAGHELLAEWSEASEYHYWLRKG